MDRTCNTCKHADYYYYSVVCRRYPPVILPVVSHFAGKGEVPTYSPVKPGTAVAVSLEYSCGEYAKGKLFADRFPQSKYSDASLNIYKLVETNKALSEEESKNNNKS